jgi:hypothetical protein
VIKTHGSELKAFGFRNAIKELKSYMGVKRSAHGHVEEVQYSIDGSNPITAAVLINKEPLITRNAIRAVYKLCVGADYDFAEKEDYLTRCISEAKESGENANTPLQTRYFQLGTLLDEFRAIMTPKLISKNQKQYISNSFHKLLDNAYVTNVKTTIINLRKEDVIIASKAISLMQGIESWSIEKSRKVIFLQLSDLCFNKSSSYIQIHGERFTECTTLKARRKKLQLLT